MTWTDLTFGKYKGLTLPQVLFRDVSWFFWLATRPLFGVVAYEVHALLPKAKRIVVPQGTGDRLGVEYLVDQGSGVLAGVQFVPAGMTREMGGSPSLILPHIDLGVPFRLARRDKTGGKIIIDFLKNAYFGSTRHKMTRERCAEFFDDPSHFLP